MKIETTPESARIVIRFVAAAARIPDADAVRIPMFFWAGGVKQPLNPSHHPSMDETSSKAGQTVATNSS
jgi:hypothetical protein